MRSTLLLLLALGCAMTVWGDAAKTFDQEAGLDIFMPDAATVVVSLDGGDTIAGASWLVTDNLLQRDLWLDMLLPFKHIGAGLSLQIVPQAPAAIGGYYQDNRWFCGLTAHTSW